MRAWTLGSGSRGNAILLEAGGTRVLVDDGYSPREIARRLASVRIAPESIEAVVVTHEHVDHARGVAAAQRKWGWRAFGTAGTLVGVADLDPARATTVATGMPFMVGGFALELFDVPHDAAEPAAVVATDRQLGFRTALAHDLGTVPDAVRDAFAGVDLLLLESNHDDDMLRSGPYPVFLQQRIAGDRGHLSNRQSSSLVRTLASAALSGVVLLHLSETNNTPRHAAAAASGALAGTRARCAVTPAPQDGVAGPFGDARAPETQMRLAL